MAAVEREHLCLVSFYLVLICEDRVKIATKHSNGSKSDSTVVTGTNVKLRYGISL